MDTIEKVAEWCVHFNAAFKKKDSNSTHNSEQPKVSDPSSVPSSDSLSIMKFFSDLFQSITLLFNSFFWDAALDSFVRPDAFSPSPWESFAPSDAPSWKGSIHIPSDVPSVMPSSLPSSIPSDTPSSLLSDAPSSIPSDAPLPPLRRGLLRWTYSAVTVDAATKEPVGEIQSGTPSRLPSDVPSGIPSETPSSIPSNVPSGLPSDTPSSIPSDAPSGLPSDAPSSIPSDAPSLP
jgi:hypothetical protein